MGYFDNKGGFGRYSCLGFVRGFIGYGGNWVILSEELRDIVCCCGYLRMGFGIG